MNKHSSWLLSEIDRWVSEQLITPDQAARLRARYATPAAAPGAPADAVPWGLLVFATAGAIIVGLGVILLFAYNWDHIPKAGKLALVFGALIAAHAGAARLLAAEGWKPRLGEAFAALGTMFFGAGIWLIAQIYNIDEHYPNGFLLWGLGALAMAWALRSTANGLITVVLLAIWGSCESFDFRQPEVSSILLIAAGLLPLAWRNRSALLLAAALLGVEFLVAVNVTNWGSGSYALTASLALGVLLVAAGRVTHTLASDRSGEAGVMLFLGYATFLVCAYILSFGGPAGTLLDWTRAPGARTAVAAAFAWGLFAGGIAGWAWLGARALRPGEVDARREDALLPIALLYAYGLAAMEMHGWGHMIAWSFTAILLGLAAMWMWRGCRYSRLAPTLAGSLILAFVTLARYFDLFHSLATRGLAFIVLGGIFIAEALYYRSVRQQAGGAS